MDLAREPISRHLASVIAERLEEEPVVVLTGARTVGKSTLLRECARRAGVGVHDLDDLETRAQVRLDPAAFVRGVTGLVCLDEFQHEPDLLAAIKAELNTDLRPGRFLLTGSTRYSALPQASQSLAGRVHVVTMWPLSQGELAGRRERFLERLFDDGPSLVEAAGRVSRPDTRTDYERRVLAGGFPIPMQRATAASRARWYSDFVTTVIERDVLEIRRVRRRQVLPPILRKLAAQTAGLLNVAAVAGALSLDAKTTGDFVELLEAVHLVHRVPAFGRALSARLAAKPKIHLVDTGLGAAMLGVTESKLAARGPSALTEFGHLLETFAVNEILKQAEWSPVTASFGHLRTKEGVEVDLVAETADGRVAGIQIKASGRVSGEEFNGLRLLRDRVGSNFVAGVVLHLGERATAAEPGLYALPLATLWAP